MGGLNYFIISSEFPPGPGGIGQHAESFTLALARRGRVMVLCNQDYANVDEIEMYNQKLSNQIELIPFSKRKGKLTSFKRIQQAIRLIKSNSPERVFVSGRFPLWIGALIKVVYPTLRVEGFVHGSEIALTGSSLSKITKWAYLKLDKIIAVSKFTKSLLHEKTPLEKVVVLPNGLDNEFLKKSKSLNPQSLNWEGSPKLLTVGNLTPRKGQHRVVAALPEIIKRFPKVHYHIVGLPTNKDTLLKQAKALGVESHISIHGRLPKRKDLYKAYASTDIFIMLSQNQSDGDLEGFGIAILEANAFGLAAIGAVGCGIEDAIDVKSGVLVEGDSGKEITNAIVQVLNNNNAYADGARRWAEKHNWEQLVTDIL